MQYKHFLKGVVYLHASKDRIWGQASHSSTELIFARMGPEPWTSHRKPLLILLFSFYFFHRLSSAIEWKLQAMKYYLFFVLFTGTSLIFFLHCVFTDLYICIYFLLLPVKGYQVQLRSCVLGERPQALTLFSFVLRIFLKTLNSFLIILWLKLIPSL